MRGLFVCILAWCIGLGASKPALAAIIDVIAKDGVTLVIVQGTFVSDDISAFKAKIGPLSKAVVAFQSDGGSVLAGIQIAKPLRLVFMPPLMPHQGRKVAWPMLW